MTVHFNDIDEAARNILRQNDKGGRYTIPAARLYPFQWNWDSCFSALGWATFDKKRAWREIETLFAHQWSDGMVAHIAFHEFHDTYFPGPDAWGVPDGRPTSGITQPPVAATITRMIYERADDKEIAGSHLRELLPKIFLYHRWFHEQRDPERTGLVAIFHPWESGRDNSPEWDESLKKISIEGLAPYKRKDLDHVSQKHRPSQDDYDRYMALVGLFRRCSYDQQAIYKATPFRIADIGINAILLRANRDLLWLMTEISAVDDVVQSQLREWISRQEKAFEKLWNEKLRTYTSRDLVSGKNIDVATSASFLAFYAGVAKGPQAESLLTYFYSWREQVRFMVPSFDPADPRFDPGRYWRGPVWAVVNFMIAKGLAESSFLDQAAHLAGDTAQMISENGFWEYFDPLSGEGLGGDHFSWTAAMWLAWARNYAD